MPRGRKGTRKPKVRKTQATTCRSIGAHTRMTKNGAVYVKPFKRCVGKRGKGTYFKKKDYVGLASLGIGV